MPFAPDYRNNRDDLPDNHDDLSVEERCRLMAERQRLLHVHGPGSWHDSVRVVGNRNALTVLRDALSAALADGQAETYAMTMDGEGFTVEIVMNDAGWEHPSWESAPLPYTDPTARGEPDPWSDVLLVRHALRMANAGLVKQGVKPVPDPTAWRDAARPKTGGERHG